MIPQGNLFFALQPQLPKKYGQKNLATIMISVLIEVKVRVLQNILRRWQEII